MLNLQTAITIDRCPACRGTWYDDGELKALLGPHYDYDTLMQNMEPEESTLTCPACRVPMIGLEYHARRFTVNLDHCTHCRGFWLDHGELDQLRDLDLVPPSRRPSGFRPRPVFPAPRPKPAEKESALQHYQSFDHARAAEYARIDIAVYLFCLFSQLPVEVHNPRKRFPGLLLGMIVVNFIIYGMMRGMSSGIMIPFVFTLGAVPEKALTLAGIYQLVTYGFLHSTWPHLLGNMYMLWVFGDNVCDVFYDHGRHKGPAMFMFFYAVLLALSGAAHCLFNFPDEISRAIPLVGASGAISGIIASYWRLFPRSRLYQIFLFYPFKVPMWFYLFIWILWNLVFMYTGTNVSWEAHFGGFIVGFLLIPYFLPFPLNEIRQKRHIL